MIDAPTNTDGCTVIVTVDADEGLPDEVVDHARAGVEHHFPAFRGFVAGRLHLSADGTRLVQLLQWESEPAYVECRDDPRWDEFDSTARFMAHARAGRIVVDARVFSVVATSAEDAHAAGESSA